jgi:hypothetical protein
MIANSGTFLPWSFSTNFTIISRSKTLFYPCIDCPFKRCVRTLGLWQRRETTPMRWSNCVNYQSQFFQLLCCFAVSLPSRINKKNSRIALKSLYAACRNEPRESSNA